jgi:DNA helicase IV
MNFKDELISFLSSPIKTIKDKRTKLIKKYIEIGNKSATANKELEKNIYMDFYFKERYKKNYSKIFDEISRSNKYLKLRLTSETISDIKRFKDNYTKVDSFFKNHNEEFIKSEKINNKIIFDNVEGISLNEQQRDCIVKEEVNNLVIAGAGCGKTTTIIGKVKYILERKDYHPKELLVLSFTNASAVETQERIQAETLEFIDVMTFHKLALSIISKVQGKMPVIMKTELYDFVSNEFNRLNKYPLYKDKVNSYFLSYLKKYKSKFQFKNQGEYFEYLRDVDVRTLKGDKVKSYEEMEISNFLFVNNISYQYERTYEVDTRDDEHGQYSPNYYLPDYKVYIEYLEIDKNGNVSELFQGKNGKTAKETYNDLINWKREVHEKYNTRFIEAYHYEKMEGTLTQNLKNNLENLGIKMNPMDRNELWALIEHENSSILKSFNKLITAYINQIKANNLRLEEIKIKNNDYFKELERNRNEEFIEILEPIYTNYEAELKQGGYIDFDDMINIAAEYVGQGLYTKKYSYIIVDEYQDISLGRYKLIKAIKDKNNSSIFCVGDDWQSTYQFAGSKLDLFTNFEEYYGYTEKSFIKTTYRFNKDLIDISSKFILENKSQIKKQLKAFNDSRDKAFELLYGEDTKELKIALKQGLENMLEGSSVSLIGRYNYKTSLQSYLDSEITCRYNEYTGECNIFYAGRKDLNIKYHTVNRTKGLAVDYVFILDNSNRPLGFPSQIEDDEVLKLLVSEKEYFEFSEERRLMYVALTRAKKFAYLMVENNCKSPFVREFEEEYSSRLSKGNIMHCPKCKKGVLAVKVGPYSSYYGCSNFPLCKYTRKVQEKNQEQI